MCCECHVKCNKVMCSKRCETLSDDSLCVIVMTRTKHSVSGNNTNFMYSSFMPVPSHEKFRFNIVLKRNVIDWIGDTVLKRI